MTRFACIPTLLAVTFCCSVAIAQEVARFTELTACRIDAESVLLRATFDGGACMSVEPAHLAEPRGTIVAVHLPTVSTAEICTMQIVPIEVKQVIEADEVIADLFVTVSDPQNNELAQGQVEVADHTEDCVAPQG